MSGQQNPIDTTLLSAFGDLTLNQIRELINTRFSNNPTTTTTTTNTTNLDINTEPMNVNVEVKDEENYEIITINDDSEVEAQEELKADYEVEKVCDDRVNPETGEIEYLLQFKGYSQKDWVGENDCNCEALIHDYFKSEKRINTIYCIIRVSSTAQATPEKLSLEQQQDHITNYISQTLANTSYVMEYGGIHNFRRVFIDLIGSSFKKIMPEIDELRDIANKGDIVLCYHPDRLCRDLYKFTNWFDKMMQQQVIVGSTFNNCLCDPADGNPENATVFKTFVQSAQNEALALSRRMRETYRARRQRGDSYIGGAIRYGFTNRNALREILYNEDGSLKLIENFEEMNNVRFINDKIRTKSNREIAEDLNSRARTHRRGKAWRSNMVNTIRTNIRNGYYVGYI